MVAFLLVLFSIKNPDMKKINISTANAIFRLDQISIEADALEPGAEICLKTGAKIYKLKNGIYLDGYDYNEGRDLERYREVTL